MTNEEVAVKLANHENRLKVSEHRIEDLEESQKQIYENHQGHESKGQHANGDSVFANGG